MICKKCHKVTDDRCFATYKDRKGNVRRRGVCKDCRGKYATENFESRQQYRLTYNQKNRTKKRENDFARRVAAKAYVDAIKSATPCADCNKKFPPVAMDFDHVRGKNKGIANLVSGAYKIDLIIEEIKFCDLVCACCHRIRTRDRKQNLSAPKGAA